MGCVGQDLNLGTPTGQRPQRCAFDHAWQPTQRAEEDGASYKTFRRGKGGRERGPYASSAPEGRTPYCAGTGPALAGTFAGRIQTSRQATRPREAPAGGAGREGA